MLKRLGAILAGVLAMTAAIAGTGKINWAPRLPVALREVRLSVQELAPDAKPGKWRIQPLTPGRNAVEIVPDAGVLNAAVKWTPTETGFYQIALLDESNQELLTETLPVVWREIHLLSWENPEDCRYVGTSVFINPGTIQEHAYWRGRGSNVLSGVWVRPGNLFGKSDEEVMEFFVSRAKSAADSGADGIYIDELGVYPDENGLRFMAQCAKAFAKIRELYPNLKVFSWTGGPVQREEIGAARDNGHIFMLEVYPEFSAAYFGGHTFRSKLESWVSNIRNQDALCNLETGAAAVMTLGICGNCGNTDRALIEERLRIMREVAPESPGICFYYGNLRHTQEKPVSTTFEKLLDELSMTYFIRPVLTIYSEDLFWSPRPLKAGEKVTVKVLVRNIGGMAAHDVKVRLWFRDFAGKVTPVGETTLSEVGNGMVSEAFDGAFYPEPFKLVNGTRRMVAGPRGGNITIFLDRALAEFSWTPETAAHGEMTVEIVPDENNTLLNGLVTKEVVIR